MITIKTKTEFPIRNSTYEIIGSKIISLSIQKIEQDSNGVTAFGFYHYTDSYGSIIKLKDNKTYMDWLTIYQIETDVLEPMNNVNYQDASFKRISDFMILKLTEESGTNFGINIEDWDV